MQVKTRLTLAVAAAMFASTALRAEEKAMAPAAAAPAKSEAKPAADAAQPAEAKADGAAAEAKPAATPVAKNDNPGSVKQGNELIEAGKFDEAIAYFNGIGEQTTSNGHTKREPWRLVGLSSAQIGAGKFEDAAATAQKAIDIDPNLNAAWNNLGSALANQGKRSEAIEAYNKGIEALKAAGKDTSKLEGNVAALKAAADEAQAKADKKAGKVPAKVSGTAKTEDAKPAAEAPKADAPKADAPKAADTK